MATLLIGTLGGLAIAGSLAVFARQRTIDEASARTGGYF